MSKLSDARYAKLKSVFPPRDPAADFTAGWTKRLVDIDCSCPQIPDTAGTCSLTCRYCMEHSDELDDVEGWR